MELTNELKAKFFSQYWGQNVQLFRGHLYNNVDPLNDEPLELKPLSSISDEDSIDALRILFPSHLCSEKKEIKENLLGILHKERNEMRFISLQGVINCYDYLRSKGYALPFMGISVEEMVKAGWIKLKEDK